MGIDRAHLEDVSWSDLQELVDGGVPEAIRLEYKREPYGGSDDDKRELLKDVSALANSSGGHLIIGIAESDGCADALVGVNQSTVDAEIRRVENIVRTSVEPRIVGLRMQPVMSPEGRAVIVIRVQRSWNGPHRVTFKSLNKFYVRSSVSVNEASVEELRAMFTSANSARERAVAFRDSRLAAIDVDDLQIPPEFRGAMVLHMVPTSAMSDSTNVDLELAYEQHQRFRPIDASSFSHSPQFNFDGFVTHGNSRTGATFTQFFRDGCVESIVSGIVWRKDDHEFLSGEHIERAIFERAVEFLPALQAIGVDAPILVFVTLLDTQGATYKVDEHWFHAVGSKLPRAKLTMPPCLISDYGDQANYHQSLKPIADCLWNSTGKSTAQWFNPKGIWTAPRWAC